MQFSRRSALVILVVSLLCSGRAGAYYFVPTEVEWNTWPEYCRAKYVGTGIGETSPFANRVSPAERARWAKAMGDPFVHIHHYCAGIAYMQRYMSERNPARRSHLLDLATGEMVYTFRRIEPASNVFPDVAKNLAMAHRYAGNHKQAIGVLEQSIAVHPQYAPAYSALSLIYRDVEKPELQEQVLRKGLAASADSAELHYFLGLMLANQKRYTEAVDHAHKAYDLGYPLPGLKRKLQRAGYTLERNTDTLQGNAK